MRGTITANSFYGAKHARVEPMTKSAVSSLLWWVIAIGLLAVPLIPFYVSSSMFFPFITGKNFIFRFIVELIFLAWVTLIVFDRKYRPHSSPIAWAMAALVAALAVATVFGADPSRSFWSNFERMEGLIGFLHLFAYFLIIGSVFLRSREWWLFGHVSLGMSVVLSIFALFQQFGIVALHQGDRVNATLGNATYFAVYLLFHLFFLIALMLSSKRWLSRGIYGAIFLLELSMLYYTATRGAVLGFVGGIFVLGILLLLFAKQRTRMIGAALVAVYLALVGGFFLLRNNTVLHQNKTFARLASLSVTPGDPAEPNNPRARFTIWGMALKGVGEHPVFGWGPENFNVVFNKYYDPLLFRQEPWFDRVHNVVLDWLISAGALGLLSYLALFGTSVWVVWRAPAGGEKQNQNFFERKDASVISALFAGYLFQNLFVFDNLTSYVLFFSVLAFIHTRYIGQKSISDNNASDSKNVRYIMSFKPIHFFILIAVFIFGVFVIYEANIKPVRANKHLLSALKQMREGTVDGVVNSFRQALSYGTFANLEAREQLAVFAANVALSSNFSKEQKQEVLQFSYEEMQKQVTEHPRDARALLFLGNILLSAGRFHEARAIYQKALELSPRKQQILFSIADTYLSENDYEFAFGFVEQAYRFYPFPDVTVNYAAVATLSGRYELADKMIDELLKNSPGIFSDSRSGEVIINAYAQKRRFEKLLDVWRRFIELNPTNTQYRVSLAATYAQLGQRQNAIKELQKVIEINPAFKEQGERLIGEIEAGKTP